MQARVRHNTVTCACAATSQQIGCKRYPQASIAWASRSAGATSWFTTAQCKCATASSSPPTPPTPHPPPPFVVACGCQCLPPALFFTAVPVTAWRSPTMRRRTCQVRASVSLLRGRGVTLAQGRRLKQRPPPPPTPLLPGPSTPLLPPHPSSPRLTPATLHTPQQLPPSPAARITASCPRSFLKWSARSRRRAAASSACSWLPSTFAT
jgi:hypothetical protein